MLKYSFPKSVSLSQIETRVHDIYSMAKICKWDSKTLTSRLMEQISYPLNEKYPSGRRKHSVWVGGYASGLIAAMRSRIWQEDVEFCYMVDGVLYSTHQTSTKPTTGKFYADGKGYILADAEGRHYWKDSEKAFS